MGIHMRENSFLATERQFPAKLFYMNLMGRYLLMETKHNKMPFWEKNLDVVGRNILNEHITLRHSSGAGHCSSLFLDCVRKADNICLPDERT